MAFQYNAETAFTDSTDTRHPSSQFMLLYWLLKQLQNPIRHCFLQSFQPHTASYQQWCASLGISSTSPQHTSVIYPSVMLQMKTISYINEPSLHFSTTKKLVVSYQKHHELAIVPPPITLEICFTSKSLARRSARLTRSFSELNRNC
jgi:hypothetical protein